MEMIAPFLLSLAATPLSLAPVPDAVTNDMSDFCVPFMRASETVETMRSQMLLKGLKTGAGNELFHGELKVQVAESRDGLRTCSISTSQTFAVTLAAVQRWPNIYTLTQLQNEPGFHRWEGTRYFLSVTETDDSRTVVTFTKKRG
ncbi:MAG: hypothetical protein EOP60_02540 [Sphingomonadales bacterium]|nr:MAG: hypothetical protein EOP60_02540 [Sphingomonadales bacterium]